MSFYEHLVGEVSVASLEEKLDLKTSVGLPDTHYVYDSPCWSSKEEYNEFVKYCVNAPSAVCVADKSADVLTRSGIVYYKERFYAVVARVTQDESCVSACADAFDKYIDALKYVNELMY